MEIIVCIKQVPETGTVKIDPQTNTLIREGIPCISNPFDMHALEAGLRLKESYGGRVTVLSMGPPQAVQVLKEALSMGADSALLLSDSSFAGADTLATAYTLSLAIKRLGKFDIILCGKQAIDGDTAQVGPELAEFLGIPSVAYVKKIELTNGILRVERRLEDSYEVIETKPPTLLTVSKEMNAPRLPSLKGLLETRKKEIPVWRLADLGVEAEKVGLLGSGTRVDKIFAPERKKETCILEGSPEDIATELLARLKQRMII